MKRRDFNFFVAALLGLGVKSSTIKEAATSIKLDIDELNLLFAASEKAINDMVVRKVIRNSNAYWGKIQEGNFPSNQGAAIKKRRTRKDDK